MLLLEHLFDVKQKKAVWEKTASDVVERPVVPIYNYFQDSAAKNLTIK